MSQDEEVALILGTGCSKHSVETLINFADKYRSTMTSDLVQKNRKLGTRALVRIARRLAKYPDYVDLHAIFSRAVLAEFLPAAERMSLDAIFEELGIKKITPPVSISNSLTVGNALKLSTQFNPSPVVENGILVFPAPTWAAPIPATSSVQIPLFSEQEDQDGVASHVPHMAHFYDNSLQTSLMRDLAIDLEVLEEHLVLLGNQVRSGVTSVIAGA